MLVQLTVCTACGEPPLDEEAEHRRSLRSYQCVVAMEMALLVVDQRCNAIPVPPGANIRLTADSPVLGSLIEQGLLRAPVTDAWGHPLVLRTAETDQQPSLPERCRALFPSAEWSSTWMLVSTGTDGRLDEEWSFGASYPTQVIVSFEEAGGDIVVQPSGRERVPGSPPADRPPPESGTHDWDKSRACDWQENLQGMRAWDVSFDAEAGHE